MTNVYPAPALMTMTGMATLKRYFEKCVAGLGSTEWQLRASLSQFSPSS
jgi:hypothetical protein